MQKSLAVTTICACLLLLAASLSANNIPRNNDNGAVMTRADIMLSTVHSFIEAQEIEKALSAAEELVEKYTNHPSGWMLLGYCRTLNEKYAASNDAYSMALSIGADKKEIYNRMAYNYIKMKDWTNARESYKAVVELGDSNVEALMQLAYLEEKLKSFDNAAVYYQKALEFEPRNIKVIGAMARIEEKRGKKEEARFWLEKGLAAYPQDKKFLKRYSGLLLNEQKYEKALPYTERLVALDSSDPSAQRNLGIAYYGLGRKKEAKAAFESVRKAGGSLAGIYGPLAESYRATGEPKKALAVVKEGLGEKNQVAWLYCIWGKLLEQWQDFDGAIAMFNKAAGLREAPWDTYAEKQIARQVQLKKRAELMAAQAAGE